jgi:hypothetical protein
MLKPETNSFFVAVTAVAGLAVAPAPDVVRSLPFLEPLLSTGALASGIATVLLPAVVATLFIVLAIYLIRCELIGGYYLIPASDLRS